MVRRPAGIVSLIQTWKGNIRWGANLFDNPTQHQRCHYYWKQVQSNGIGGSAVTLIGLGTNIWRGPKRQTQRSGLGVCGCRELFLCISVCDNQG